MPDLTETLAAIRELHENDYDGGHPYTPGDPYDTAHKTAGKMLAAVEAVLKLHRKAPLYGDEDECANPDEGHREDRHFEIDGEYVCESLIEDWTCAECYETQGIASLAEPISWPCDTVRALTQALEGNDDERTD